MSGNPSDTQVPVGDPASQLPVVEDDLDGELLPASAGRRTDRLTVLLVAALIAVAGFGGGAWWEKRDAGAATGRPAGFPAAGPAGGFGEGGVPGGTAGAGQAAGAVGAAGAGQAAGTSASTSPVAVGTVVSIDGTTLTLKNLGGKTVKVTVPAGTTVSRTATVGLFDLTAGTTVSVTGTAADDGTVTASGVTARP